MPDEEEIANQRNLLAARRRTLAHLLEQQASFDTAHTPAHVANGIHEARGAIRQIKKALRGWGQAVEELPDDEPTTGPSGEEALAAALRLLAALPLDAIPDPAPLPPGSRMPLARNRLFVGREGDLRALAAALKGGATVAIGQVETAAATGIGGIGKTQLAVELVHRYGQFFAGGVFWLNFADPDGVPAEVAVCGGAGYLDMRPDFAGLPIDEQVRLVLAAWGGLLPRLLVFDNCEDEALLARWRPASGGCRVLLTSRRAEWDAALGVCARPLGVLSRAESIALLRGHRPDLPADDAGLDAIADELGDLALALHLAGSFLARYRHDLTPAGYLAELRDAALLQHESLRLEGVSPTGHLHHVARTFALSYERLDPADPADAAALALLARAAHLAPGVHIPRDLLKATLDATHPAARFRDSARGLVQKLLARATQLASNVRIPRDKATQEASDTTPRFREAARRLVELGLLESETDGALRLHRLLAAFVYDRASDDAARAAVEQALLDTANRLNNAGIPAPLLALQPHLRAVTDVAQQREDECAAGLCNTMGYHLQMIGDYVGARPYYERALAIREQVLGPQHPNTATSLNNLGMLLKDLGDLQAVRSYFERALAIREQVLGPQHPDTATSLNNLGSLLQDLGDLQAARPYYERALAIFESRLGADHPTTRIVRANLATLDAPPQSVEEQIAAIERQAGEEVARALDAGTSEERAALAARLEERARWAEQGEEEGSPLRGLAARLREMVARLESQPTSAD